MKTYGKQEDEDRITETPAYLSSLELELGFMLQVWGDHDWNLDWTINWTLIVSSRSSSRRYRAVAPSRSLRS
jgi:hypothetical protein